MALIDKRRIASYTLAVDFLENSFPHIVDLNESQTHIRSNFQDLSQIMDWVLEHTGEADAVFEEREEGGRYTGFDIDVQGSWAMMSWVWYFKDPDAAFQFKLRWY